MTKAKPVPAGFHTVTPYLAIHHARKVIDFLKAGLGGEELEVHAMPDGRIMNAIVRIRDSMVFIGEKPLSEEAWPGMLYLYVEDVDALFKRAVQAGGKVVMEPTDHFYGDRSGAVEDAAGNQWWIASRIEDVSSAELAARAAQAKR